MSDDPWLTVIDQADIEAALQRKKSRDSRLVEQEAEIARLRAALVTARREGMEDAAKLNVVWFFALIGAAFVAAALVGMIGFTIYLYGTEVVGWPLTLFGIFCFFGWMYVWNNWDRRPWKKEVKS